MMLDAVGIEKHAIEKGRVLKTLPRNKYGEWYEAYNHRWIQSFNYIQRK